MLVSDVRYRDNLIFHPRSITRKNSDGKTCGVIRFVERFKELPFNKQIEVSAIVRKNLNIDRSTFMNEFKFDRLYLSKNKKVYYFIDTRFNNPIYFHNDNLEIVNF